MSTDNKGSRPEPPPLTSRELLWDWIVAHWSPDDSGEPELAQINRWLLDTVLEEYPKLRMREAEPATKVDKVYGYVAEQRRESPRPMAQMHATWNVPIRHQDGTLAENVTTPCQFCPFCGTQLSVLHLAFESVPSPSGDSK